MTTTDPTVTSEITSENTCIDCSGGDYFVNSVDLTELQAMRADVY